MRALLAVLLVLALVASFSEAQRVFSLMDDRSRETSPDMPYYNYGPRSFLRQLDRHDWKKRSLE